MNLEQERRGEESLKKGSKSENIWGKRPKKTHQIGKNAKNKGSRRRDKR